MSQSQQFTLKGWVVWGVCALFFLYEFMLRTVVGTFQHPIMYDLELSTFKFAILSSTSYVLIYGIMQIPVGLVLDNLGLKKTLGIASALCTLSLIGFALSRSFPVAILFRLFTGLASSVGFICLAYAVFDWMPKSKRAFMIGLSQFVGTLGPVIAAGPIDAIAESSTITWRILFFILSGIGAIITLLVFIVVTNNPQHVGSYRIVYKPEKTLKRLSALFKSSTPWLVACFTGFIYLSIEYLSENEGRNFIVLKGFKIQFASYLISIAWLTYAICCPILGYLSDLTQKRKPLMYFTIACLIVGLFGILFANSKPLLIISFIFLGIGGSGQSLSFVIIAEYFKDQHAGLAISLNNAFLCVCSALNGPALSAIIEFSQQGPEPTAANYSILFYTLIGVVSILTIGPLLFVPETYAKSQAEFTRLAKK